MRLSPWHCELAKLVAQGKPNREIMRIIKVSGNRLSVLKANPIFAQKITEYQRIEDDKYKKAVDVFSLNAEKVAQQMVRDATNLVVPPATRHVAQKDILDRVAESEGAVRGRKDEDTVVFEQLLRVTKRTSGKEFDSSETDDIRDLTQAYEQLNEDFELDTTIEPEVVKSTLSFVKELNSLPKDTKLEVSGDNGGRDVHNIRPGLARLLRH